MSVAYWMQWDHAELLSLHGVEYENERNDIDLDHHEDEEDQKVSYEIPYDRDMLTQRDFL